MTNTFLSSLTIAVGIVATVAEAHGYVQGVVADGTYYQGYRPNFQYLASPPVIPSWSDPLNIDNGYVSNYTSPDIICHLGATPGKTLAPVKAGGSVQLQWTDWPEGHLGPVITYLANCNGNCTNVDKTKLLFNKIDEAGLLQMGSSTGTSMRWAAQALIANNNSWTVQIPQNIAPGQYVLRHEIISLQEAMVYGGAQNYPQCVNLVVTGSGTNSLQSGTLGTKLYTHDDPGIHIDIYQTLNNYTIPGPQLIGGASNSTQPGVNATTTLSSLTRSSTSTSTSSSTSTSTSTSVSVSTSTSSSSITSTTVANSNSSFSSSSSTSSSSVTGSSSGATISITFSLSSTLSSAARSSLTVAGQGFYTASPSVSQTTSTLASISTDAVGLSDNSSSTTSLTSTTSLMSDTTTSAPYSTITAAFSTNATTFQTVTRSDSSISAGIFLGSVSVNVTTTLVKITVTVPGNFADPPLPTNATLSTTSPFNNTTSIPYPLTNTTLSAPYPFTNATATSLNGTGIGYSTGFGTAYSTGLGTAYSTRSGTAYSSGSGITYSSTSTANDFVAWIQATTTSAPIDNGYKPRRNVRYVKPRRQQGRWVR